MKTLTALILFGFCCYLFALAQRIRREYFQQIIDDMRKERNDQGSMNSDINDNKPEDE